MSNISSQCIHTSDLIVTPGRLPLEVVRNITSFASNTRCEPDRFRNSQPSLVLPYNPLRISRVFLLCIFVVLLAWVSPVCRAGYAEQSGNGNDPDRSASGRCNAGTDGFGALDSLERGYNPLGPHGSKRKRDRDHPQTSKSISRKQATRTFACHFYLHDRIRHSDCLNIKLKRLSDVRQHLLERAHNQVVHCPDCGDIFSGSIAEARRRRDAHVQARTCEPSPSPPDYPGITEDEERRIREIARNTRTNQYNEVQRWYRIWDFLFPGEEHPASPFLTDLPDVQRMVDWRNEIFGNDLWRQLPTDPWTTAMNPDQQRSGLLSLFDSFFEQVRGLLGHDPGPIEDDHGADNSSYIGANTPGPSGANALRRVASLTSVGSNRPVDAARQAYLSPPSFAGSRQGTDLPTSTGDLPAAVAPVPSHPPTDPAVDVPQDIEQESAPADAVDAIDMHDPTLPSFALDGSPFETWDMDFGFLPMLGNEDASAGDGHSPRSEDELGGGH